MIGRIPSRSRLAPVIGLLVATALAALLATSCGGASSKTTPGPGASSASDEKAALTRYHHDLSGVKNDFGSLIRLLKSVETGKFTDPIVITQAFNNAAQRFSTLAQRLATITPPPRLLTAHTKLIYACTLLAGSLHGIEKILHGAVYGIVPDKKAVMAAVARAKRSLKLATAWERAVKAEAKRLGVKIT